MAIFAFEEVNYGILDFLPTFQLQGIAYDSAWESGGSYETGMESVRFGEQGEVIIKTVFTSRQNPDLNNLLQHIDDPMALRQAVITHRDAVTSLPWDNQVEYGKRYGIMRVVRADIK